jgi:starvation-inducible DNA-binding protein
MSDYKMDIGLEKDDCENIAVGLKHLLADTYTLYLKTHNFHWNVVGPKFRELHLMFEEQYTELATAVDDIAERIRALGLPAPGTYTEMNNLTVIKETCGVPSGDSMIQILTQDNEAVVRTARRVLDQAQKAGDESSVSLIADRMVIHEKTAWMLRSLMG